MASSINFIVLASFFLLIITPSLAQTSFRPKALVLPVTKDASTLQYLTHIKQRTPLVDVLLTIDVGGEFLWVDCFQGFNSSTFVSVTCNSAQCNLALAPACGVCDTPRPPGCIDQCVLSPDNPIIGTGTAGDLRSDVLSVLSTDGVNPGRAVFVPKFLFTCAFSFLTEGLASGVTGMAGLGRAKIGMPSRFAEAFSLKRKFAICLSSSTTAKGVLFFGDGPYSFLPGIDVSESLTYTPLLMNPADPALAFTTVLNEYFIQVNSVNINGKNVPLNKTLLSFDKEGNGGTKISTVNPYTVLETSIYKAVTQLFVKELSNIPRVASVAPFEICYDSKNIGSTRLGPSVPPIDLVLPNGVVWTIVGANSMVSVENGKVLCLGFVDGGLSRLDGGLSPNTAIVIGGHQIENNLLQFDLAATKLGFSGTLFSKQTSCSNFNFTTKA